jgi:hypothetical protein
MSGLRTALSPSLAAQAESAEAPNAGLAWIPAGKGTPRVHDRRTGSFIGLHVPPLDDATHVGVMFRQRTGRGQGARPLMLARCARDRVQIVQLAAAHA